YTHTTLDSLDPGRLMFTPLLVDMGPVKLTFAEADVEAYPGMYLRADTASRALRGYSAPYPAAVEQGGHNDLEHLVTARHPYIAHTDGRRAFPWRSFIVSRSDTELPASDMVYRLASPSRVADTSWIRPGKVAWEWWNDWGLYGVPFRAGINTDTYRAYIDFAADHGIEYVILDEGWATKGRCDLFDIVPEIDLPALLEHAEKRGVGIILWAGYLAMARDLERVVAEYARAGVKGFKIDFLNRDDAEMIDFMYRTADICACHHMLVDFHGCPKPTGLQRTYPNVVNYEAVFGLEQMKWSTPTVDQVTYDVTLPFIRSVAGPMDYTQGAMTNASRGQYFPSRSNPMSQGTRCHQLAEFVIFDSPLSMLCDSPSAYAREPECTELIAAIPTVWDATEVPLGCVGEYIVTARRSGDRWYIGGLTGWDARSLTLPLDFLPDGVEYDARIFADGPNAAKHARDFVSSEAGALTAGSSLAIDMAPGGGYVAILTPKNVK
ncbi:MAG: glycoside hydrolase family 97 protein, partial [Bacteroides sp.]|nr:glycoside hydrolase family 97 protein [Bacteroides sp.]